MSNDTLFGGQDNAILDDEIAKIDKLEHIEKEKENSFPYDNKDKSIPIDPEDVLDEEYSEESDDIEFDNDNEDEE